MRLAVFTGSFETALLWLNSILDIGTGVILQGWMDGVQRQLQHREAI